MLNSNLLSVAVKHEYCKLLVFPDANTATGGEKKRLQLLSLPFENPTLNLYELEIRAQRVILLVAIFGISFS